MHNLKIHKLSDDKSIAMILKEMQENKKQDKVNSADSAFVL